MKCVPSYIDDSRSFGARTCRVLRSARRRRDDGRRGGDDRRGLQGATWAYYELDRAAMTRLGTIVDLEGGAL